MDMVWRRYDNVRNALEAKNSLWYRSIVTPIALSSLNGKGHQHDRLILLNSSQFDDLVIPTQQYDGFGSSSEQTT